MLHASVMYAESCCVTCCSRDVRYPSFPRVGLGDLNEMHNLHRNIVIALDNYYGWVGENGKK